MKAVFGGCFLYFRGAKAICSFLFINDTVSYVFEDFELLTRDTEKIRLTMRSFVFFLRFQSTLFSFDHLFASPLKKDATMDLFGAEDYHTQAICLLDP